MNIYGWIFMITFWLGLIIATAWSYKVLLSEPHIPVGPLEDEHHPIQEEE